MWRGIVLSAHSYKHFDLTAMELTNTERTTAPLECVKIAFTNTDINVVVQR